MTKSESEWVLSIPYLYSESKYQEFQRELSQQTEEVLIVIDFQNIKTVDYYFLNSFLSMTECLSPCVNAIKFINCSHEVRELIKELNPDNFSGSFNLLH